MKTHLNMKTMVHLVMVAFAGASLGNVKAFLVGAGHPAEVAWLLGGALGLALVTVSIMLTHVNRDSDKVAFNWLLGTGVLLGVISGSLQSAEYAKHLHWAWAGVLGFGVPLGGEVGLAIAAAGYTKARERERFRNVATVLEGAVADQLEAAVAEFDPAQVRKHMDRTIVNLSRLAIDSVAGHAATFYAPPSATLPTMDAHPSTVPVLLDARQDAPQGLQDAQNVHYVEMDGGTPPEGVQRATAARTSKADARQAELYDWLKANFDGRPTDDLNKTEVGRLFGTTRQTIGRDLEALADAGKITVNGVVKVL